MALIKRYSNRKLYNFDEKKYITLEEISDLILGGETIRVIDHKTGDDLTARILTQIIQAQEKKKRGVFSLLLLEKIIRDSSINTVTHGFKFSISATINRIVENEIEGRLKSLVLIGKITTTQESLLRQELLSNLSETLSDHWDDEQAIFLTSAELEECLCNYGLPSNQDLSFLNEQIHELFKKVENLYLQNNEV